MKQILVVALICAVSKCNGVIVHGNTVAPGFSRGEGLSTISCPSSNPYACGGGTKCTSSFFKPQDNSDPDCDGGAVDLYRVV